MAAGLNLTGPPQGFATRGSRIICGLHTESGDAFDEPLTATISSQLGLDCYSHDMHSANAPDPFDLQRFVRAQEGTYERALSELKNGQKRSHWMWYVFPQFEGLGFSHTSHRYAIKSVAEARAYLAHQVLGPRLVECATVLYGVEDLTANEIFGFPDDLKLRSCATLFAHVSADDSVFHRLIDKYFDGQHDEATLQLIAKTGSGT